VRVSTKEQIVSLRSLKKQVAEAFPGDFEVVKLILQEKDEMQGEEFMAKSDVWQKLLAAEVRSKEQR
jgi:hypothetical protein